MEGLSVLTKTDLIPTSRIEPSTVLRERYRRQVQDQAGFRGFRNKQLLQDMIVGTDSDDSSPEEFSDGVYYVLSKFVQTLDTLPADGSAAQAT